MAREHYHPQAGYIARIIRALLTDGEWVTMSRVQLAQALAMELKDLVELELRGSCSPQATLRLRPVITLAPHSRASAGEAS